MFAFYHVAREPGMLAIAAVIMLLVKSGTLRVPQGWLAAVGKMALSNYLLTSLICQFLFVVGAVEAVWDARLLPADVCGLRSVGIQPGVQFGVAALLRVWAV